MAEEVKEAANDSIGTIIGGLEREKIYDNYEKSQSQPKAEPEPKVEAKEEPVAEEPAKEEPKKEEAPPKKEEFKTKEDKTVPYDALHQEREKRKSAQSRIKELEVQLHTVLQDFKSQKDAQKKVETTEVSDYEKSIKELMLEVGTLKNELQGYKRNTDEERQQRVIKDIETQKDKVADDLTKEGFPLFRRLEDLVAREILKMAEDSEDRIAFIREMDTPEGWKKVYREKIFPDIKGNLIPIQKEEINEKKVELKKQAKLSGVPSGKASDEKKEDGWSYEDYLKERRKSGIAQGPL